MLTILAALAAPVRARAFYDPATFVAPALEGGGGGRFFTGSPADGQTCATCHTAGEPPSVDVSGLPPRYVPGGTYELLVTWPPELGDVGAMLEVTDEQGEGAGTLSLPSADAVSDEELCEPRSQHILGTRLFDAADGRAIAGLGGCGASALRVQWTAPKSNVGPVWLAGAVVASNQEGDVEGDGVTNFIVAVPYFGQKTPSTAHKGCAVLPMTRGPRGMAAFAAVALCLLFVRRRRSLRTALGVGLATCVLTACHEESLLDPGPPRSTGPVALHAGEAVDPWQAVRLQVDSAAPIGPVVDAGEAQDAGADADASEDAQGPPPPPFQLRFTTLAQGGEFAPKNIGAVWVQDANGAWVKTLSLWATISLRYLSRYVKANSNGNTVDAITSATLNAHQEHMVIWNLSNARGATVPDGRYHVLVEVTDRNGPGKMLDLEFVKGPDPQIIDPPDTPSFTHVELRYAGQ